MDEWPELKNTDLTDNERAIMVHQRYLELARRYYHENKESVTRKYREVVHCECGACVQLGGLAKHKKSNKHMKGMLNKK